MDGQVDIVKAVGDDFDGSDDRGHKCNETEERSSDFLVNDLIQRARLLLSELEELRQRLRSLRLEGSVELAHFRGMAASECTMLEKLAAAPSDRNRAHVARSSNIPFLEHVWSCCKQSQDLLALHKRVYLPDELNPHRTDSFHSTKSKKGHKDNTVTIDVVSEGGRRWTKVSLVTNTRLLFDLAKQGWDSSESSEEDEPVALVSPDCHDDCDIPIIRTSKNLVAASRMTRVRTRHPSIVLMLPRVQLGVTPEVDHVIKSCRAAGVSVFCAQDLEPPPPLTAALPSMVIDPISKLTKALNVDCTILLALVSDLSHGKVSMEPWFSRSLQRQAEVEDTETLLTSLLYPVLQGRPMVCTQQAAQCFRQITDTIGTPSEKARTVLLMGDDKSKSQGVLIERLQDYSAHKVPINLRLPVKVVDWQEHNSQFHLPPAALAVGREMSVNNKSVFLYGWAAERTTLTSNRIIKRQIDRKLEEFQDLPDDVWPSIWVCPIARSLVGREKRGSQRPGQKDP